MAQLSTLGHFTRMKILPTTGRDWLGFVSLPFKAFVLVSIFIYPALLRSARPFKAGAFSGQDYMMIDPDKLPVSFEAFVIGYFIAFLALFVIAVIQGFTKNWRGAAWSSVFAVLAICFAVFGAAHSTYK